MAMKENQHVQPVIDVEAGTVTFNIKGREPLVLHSDKLHAAILKRAALVGMAQVRIVDAAAVPAADEDGNIIPEGKRLDMKRERMAALIEHYESGTDQWSRVAEGGGGKSLTVEAIAKVKQVGYDQAEAWVAEFADQKYKGDTKKALAFLRQGERVMRAMEEIRKGREPAAKIDADAALEELDKQAE